MIPAWQTNEVYLSGLLRRYRPILTASLESLLKRTRTAIATIPNTRGIWCRDFMPVQMTEDGFCQFIYDPDYLRGYDHLRTPAAACHLKTMTNCRNVDLVLDAGNVVSAVNKIILTDKVFKENPAKSRKEVRRILEEALQAECIIIPRAGYGRWRFDYLTLVLHESAIDTNANRSFSICGWYFTFIQSRRSWRISASASRRRM